MSIDKRRYTAGERARCIPGHGGMYRMSDDKGWYHLGQGPRPEYCPTAAELREHGIATGEAVAITNPESIEEQPKQMSLF